jgi:hypothetical protein
MDDGLIRHWWLWPRFVVGVPELVLIIVSLMDRRRGRDPRALAGEIVGTKCTPYTVLCVPGVYIGLTPPELLKSSR